MADTASSAPETEVGEGARFGQLIRVKPEYRERYVVLHAHPFPELIEEMRVSNQHNYSIFRRENLLFSFFEYVGDDFEADMERLADTQVAQDWWTLTDSMQEPLPDRDEDEWWASMEELYHGGPKTIPSRDAEKRAFFSQVRDGKTGGICQAYETIAGDLDTALEVAPLQNYTAYVLGTRLCTYIECTADDVGAALERFGETGAVRTLHDTLDPLLTDFAAGADETEKRQGMEPVFYMA